MNTSASSEATKRGFPFGYSALFGRKTIESVVQENNGLGPGFDAIRLFLSIAILLTHSVRMCYGESFAFGYFSESAFYPLVLSLVPTFFALSGFLVSGSAHRTKSVKVFLTHRLLRIYPALIVEISLTALILGPIFTSLPLAEYFNNSEFFSYFGSLIGRVKFSLPGVFTDNPWSGVVNQNLWTLKAEFYCYVFMAVIIVSKVLFNRTLYTFGFIGLTVTLIMINQLTGFGNRGLVFPSDMLIYYFCVGVAAYLWREHIPVSFPLFVICAITSYFILPLNGFGHIAAFPTTYCLLYIGMLKVPRIPLLQNGDYSYGIYLFGFPIQQTLVHLSPVFKKLIILFPAALLLTILFATISWHFIEKPTLRLRKVFLKNQQRPVRASQ
jgi:peptidoglycan/LPS O-acetylase OafA/YrhL